ncbi:sce7725 family protein [Enterococcus faecalis]|uniref:sce7725 family protein n=1 Tax=Enterococcus faecalis TaxID=1351 RepID=UPI0017857921|nr:sce7725 family protein [Enterococcus faecalis]MBD9892284.1 sce7725 family protein [Enterococcus faecalis]MBW4168721.1 sce7725 family protein [Enterococcus faecalis]MBW4173700.1 sce7725 family protein [Enterococcus faecalis]MBW4176589.1 sce7725 family protein [Enterococcus faecalis]MCD4999908.1 sce7725 family protein [Enterococcus faecalis]
MYFPYLRGKQYEMIALKELLSEGLIGKSIVPIIEPIKETSQFTKLIDCFASKKNLISVIQNPEVGNFKPREERQRTLFSISKGYMDALIMDNIADEGILDEFKGHEFLSIFKRPDSTQYVENLKKLELRPKYTLIPDDSRLKRGLMEYDKVILRDNFIKQKRNADYLKVSKDEHGIPDEFFSDDHLYYNKDNYVGFSDYSIIGEEYLDAGFAPVAVAIHIVYFDKSDILRIKHFVSDSNDDINDPAGKFGEALKKLVDWYDRNSESMYTTEGLSQLLRHFYSGTYPGLGVVKKLSLMHHIQLINWYLEGKPE